MVKKTLALEEFQLKEFSKYWFDLSKVTFGSLILKLFEPGAPRLETRSLLTIFSGLTFSVFFVILGLKYSKEIKEK